jgi:thioredoxin reductase
MPPVEQYDAVVVGGGPAGIAAATWLARYRRRTLVVDSGDYRNAEVVSTHGYLGRDPSAPADLRAEARAGAEQYESLFWRSGRVTRAARIDDGFELAIDGDVVRAKRIVLATGVGDVRPEIDGVHTHYGASLFHCPSCDGYEARDQPVVVLGWDAHVAGFALNLLDWARAVTVVTDGRTFNGDDSSRAALARHGIRLVEDAPARELCGPRGALSGVRLESGEVIEATMAFFSLAHQPHNELAAMLGCALSSEGCVVADSEGHTSVEGVYAAGDLTPGVQLVQVAAAKGAVAGVHSALSLHGDRTVPGSPDPAPDVTQELG